MYAPLTWWDCSSCEVASLCTYIHICSVNPVPSQHVFDWRMQAWIWLADASMWPCWFELQSCHNHVTAWTHWRSNRRFRGNALWGRKCASSRLKQGGHERVLACGASRKIHACINYSDWLTPNRVVVVLGMGANRGVQLTLQKEINVLMYCMYTFEGFWEQVRSKQGGKCAPQKRWSSF